MIYGIGVDIVQISRMQSALERWGDRFAHRIFTEREVNYCSRKVKPAARYALRFAAKEAFAKAVGLGFRDGLTFRQIEVVNTSDGKPYLILHGRSKSLCEEREIKKIFLSLSDDGPYAVAMVVLEK